MEKVCDICGLKFERGIQMKAIRKGLAPWQKRTYVCEKCENVLKLIVLKYRRNKGKLI